MSRYFGSTCLALSLALPCVWAAPVSAQSMDVADELAAMRAEMGRMAARIDLLESELEAANAEQAALAQAKMSQATAATPPPYPATAPSRLPSADIAWKGAPQISGEDGWSFKPRGRLNIDAGFVSAPGNVAVNDGFGSEARRIRLGVQGDIPGGFGYKVEADFGGGDVSLADAIITYETGNVEVNVGQHNNYQSLEELTSSLHTSFIERAAFTDAFGFERRVGASVEYTAGDVIVQGGVFTDDSDDLPAGNWSLDGRAVFAPKLGNTQLHLAGNVHFRDLESDSSTRYRQRPLVHFTDLRFINTGNLSAESERGLGLEAAMIAGPFHVAAETFWQRVGRGDLLADPTFFGGYVEAGYFFTSGDRRGYKGGKFDRVRPTDPVGKGGLGAVQVNARYDYLDLNDAGIIGGTQDSYQASLIWTATDYTRLLLNYARLNYTDAVIPAADGDTSYGVDAFGVRAQIDF